MQFLYHLGVHKTASTLLQSVAEAQIEALRAAGVYYLNIERSRAMLKQRRVLRELQVDEREAPEPDKLVALNARLMRLAEGQGRHRVAISEENRLGQPPYTLLRNGKPGAFYPLAETCLAHMTAGLQPSQVSGLIYRRRQPSLVASLYSEMFRTWVVDMDIEAFCRALDLDSFRYASLLDRIAPVLGGGVQVVPFETIRDGAAPFAADFLGRLGAEVPIESIEVAKVRPRLSADVIDHIRHIARTEPDEARRKRRARRFAANADNSGPPVVLPDWAADRLERIAEDDTAALRDRGYLP